MNAPLSCYFSFKRKVRKKKIIDFSSFWKAKGPKPFDHAKPLHALSKQQKSRRSGVSSHLVTGDETRQTCLLAGGCLHRILSCFEIHRLYQSAAWSCPARCFVKRFYYLNSMTHYTNVEPLNKRMVICWDDICDCQHIKIISSRLLPHYFNYVAAFRSLNSNEIGAIRPCICIQINCLEAGRQ